MRELGHDLGFAHEALAEGRIARAERRQHDLKRHLALHAFLYRQVNARHAAASDLALDLVTRDLDVDFLLSGHGVFLLATEMNEMLGIVLYFLAARNDA